jgi:hypothetical protein
LPARTHSDAAGVYAAAAGWVFHNLLEGGGGHGHRCGVLSRPGLRLSCSSAPTQRCLGGAATPAGQRRWISWAVHRGSCTALHLQRRRHVATVADRSLSGGLSAAAAAVATQAAVPRRRRRGGADAVATMEVAALGAAATNGRQKARWRAAAARKWSGRLEVRPARGPASATCLPSPSPSAVAVAGGNSDGKLVACRRRLAVATGLPAAAAAGGGGQGADAVATMEATALGDGNGKVVACRRCHHWLAVALRRSSRHRRQ